MYRRFHKFFFTNNTLLRNVLILPVIFNEDFTSTQGVFGNQDGKLDVLIVQ